MQGILFVDKPKEWTSFDVVNYIRKLVAKEAGVKPKTIKVGHTGTLDPLATGLLVILIGKEFTRQAMAMSKMDKVYKVHMTLGQVTDSFDGETERRPFSEYCPSLDEVNQALKSYIGLIDQVPPQFSALKVNGQRAYKIARSGQVVDLAPRQIHVYDITDINYNYPIVDFITKVSSGTYIRSLVNDLGQSLKTGAYMSDLRRLSIGEFSVDGSFSPEGLNEELLSQKLSSG